MPDHEREINSFAEFWPFYVREHSRPGTRLLHAAGTLSSTAILVGALAAGRLRLLPLALVAGYGAAWAAHFLIERNRPATFKHPLWSLAADYKMVALMLAGRMDAEAARAQGERERAGVERA